MKIEIAAQEAQNMLAFIDLAVRSQGLQIAIPAAMLAEKIKTALAEEAKANLESPQKPRLVEPAA